MRFLYLLLNPNYPQLPLLGSHNVVLNITPICPHENETCINEMLRDNDLVGELVLQHAKQ
jgi:hypothetical protein